MQFEVKKEVDAVVEWLREYFLNAGVSCAVLGISGGKDSAVAASLLVNALGAQNVIGILMPNGTQSDIDDSYKVVKATGIKYFEINIGDVFKGIVDNIKKSDIVLSDDSQKNIPPRLRMTVLYAVAQSTGALVCGTTNADEGFVGYGTKWGDMACDINPLRNFHADEVVLMGQYLGLPDEVISKPPHDGLSKKTDEQALGVTYQQIKAHINGEQITQEAKAIITKLNQSTAHKRKEIPTYKRS